MGGRLLLPVCLIEAGLEASLMLYIAGGIAYSLAKRSIAQDRIVKAEEERQRIIEQRKLREGEEKYKASRGVIEADKSQLNGSSGGAEPSAEAHSDPAPTRHAPTTETQKVLEKSKFEASEVWKSPKGGRFT
jgi:hypothetical protein